MDHIDPVKKVGEAVRLKQDRPVGNASRLLHGAQPRLILLLERLFLRLGGFGLLLLLRDQLIVLLNLCVEVVDLFAGKRDLTVDVIFLLNDRLGLLLILFDLRFQLGALLPQLRLLCTELVQLLLKLL